MSQIVELETERMFSKRKIFTTPLCMLRYIYSLWATQILTRKYCFFQWAIGPENYLYCAYFTFPSRHVHVIPYCNNTLN